MKPVKWYELEFRHLEYAIVVADCRGFLQAAISLGLDQGFLSKQIQRLEARLGFDLFDRTTRPLGLTDAGRAFLEKAHQILAQTQRAVELALETQKGKLGQLDVGINTSIANSKLPGILRAFRNQFSSVNLVLHELASYDQIERLQNHQLHVGLFHRHNLQNLVDEEQKKFSILPILHESFVVVLPKNHRFANQASISLAKLSGEKFVLPPPSLLYGLRDQIERLCAKADFKPMVEQEAAWITTVLSLVAGGMGVSLLPANVKNLQRVGVVYRDIQGSSPVLEIVAVWRSDNNSAILENFLDVVRRLS
jgi:DNA-binding transcriptional LysR family regulator